MLKIENLGLDGQGAYRSWTSISLCTLMMRTKMVTWCNRWWLLRGGRIVVRKFRKIGLWCEMSQSYIIQGNIWFTGRLSQRFRVHHLVKHRSKLVDFWRQVFGRTIWSFEKQSRQRENNVSWQAIIYRAPLLGWRDLAAPKESAIRLFLKLQIFYPFKLYFLKLAPKARNGFC